MTVDCFVDTNVLIYAVSGAADEGAKQQRANAILAEGKFGISGQVLQEFFVTVTKKAALGVSAEEAAQWIEQCKDVPCVAVDHEVVLTAVSISKCYQISHWERPSLPRLRSCAPQFSTPRTSTTDSSTARFAPSIRSGASRRHRDSRADPR